MRSLFRSFSLRRLFAAVFLLAAVPLSIAATHYAVPAAGSATSASRSHVSASSGMFALNSQWSTTARNARLSAINTAAASGFLDFYSGAQPANADAAVTGTQLCSITLGATPFTTPASGSMSNNGAVSCTGTAGATGTGTAAGYVVLYKSDHTTVLWMGSVGTSSANITLPSTTITTGETVSIANGAFSINDNASISGQ